MSRKYLMSWVSSQKRWSKRHNNKQHVISCKALGVPGTKDASWRAANEWWKSKLAEIDAYDPLPHPHQESLDLLKHRLDWAISQGQKELADDIADQLAKMEKLKESDELEAEWPAKSIELAKLFGIDVPADIDPVVAGHFFGERRIWQDRLSRDWGSSTPIDRTVGHLVDRWVQDKQKRVSADQMSPDRADNIRICLHHFRDFLHAASPVDVIDANMLDKFYYHCLGRVRQSSPTKLNPKSKTTNPIGETKSISEWSLVYASKVFSIARSFVRYLWERDYIPLPKNIEGRNHRFGNSPKKIPTFTVEEVKQLVEAATGQLKLHLMLMINCGMTQKDISDLRHSEIEWDQGRITRKRSKTRKEQYVPEASYQLWPLTHELLSKHRSTDPEWALLTESKNRWVTKSLINGKLCKADNIASCYVHLKRKTGIKKSLKVLRSTSATLIESHKEYGRYKHHFLSHSPRGIADRHYAAPSNALFDEIVHWLGKEYGFC